MNNLIYKNREDKVLDLIPECSCLMDLGCGNGSLIKKAFSKYRIGEGHDISQSHINLAKQKALWFPDVHFYQKDLNKISAEGSGLMNVITCISVLEYLKNPKQFLLEVFKLLHPAGTFIIQVPNSSYFFNISTTTDVLWFFDHDILETLLMSVGFEIVETTNSGWFHSLRAIYRPFLAGDIIYVCQKP